MVTAAGSPGTARDGYRVPKSEGRHRAPPPPVPTPRTPTVIAVAAAVLTAASLVAIAINVAPDASGAGVHGSRVSTTARAERTVLTAGPLAIPTVGAEGAWDPPSTATAAPRNPLRRPVPSRSVRTSTRTLLTPEALRNDSVAILAPSSATDPTPTPTVTPAPQPVTTTTTAAPPPTTAAASSSATPTSEEPAVTPTTSASVTVGVTAGATP